MEEVKKVGAGPVSQSKLTRRELLRLGAVAGGTLAAVGGLTGILSGCGVTTTPSGSTSSSQPTSAGPSGGTTTVAIEIDEGQNARPFLWAAEELKKQFNVEPKIIGLPFVGQYEKIVAELISRSDTYDLLVFPPMDLGDFVAKGFLRPLDEYTQLIDPKLDDILPVYRDPCIKRNGKLYALPYDGDLLQVTYRGDLFEDPKEQAAFKSKYGRDLQPPKTWEEFMEIAEFFTRPPQLYGTAFYGQRGFCYAWFINIFAAYGGKWFTPDMKAAINSDAGVKALEMLVKMKKYAPPNILQIGYPELNGVFLNGSTAMVVQWDDLALKCDNPKMSKVVGKARFAPCPVRSYMPYSRVMAVSAYSKRPKEAYQVAAWMTTHEMPYVYDPEDGEDPFRYSQLDPALVKTHTGEWALTTEEQRKSYVEAIKEGLKAGYPELSIPGAPRYLDTLDLFVNQALAGTLSPKEALDNAAREWDSLTASLGVDSQKAAYDEWVKEFQAAGVEY